MTAAGPMQDGRGVPSPAREVPVRFAELFEPAWPGGKALGW